MNKSAKVVLALRLEILDRRSLFRFRHLWIPADHIDLAINESPSQRFILRCLRSFAPELFPHIRDPRRALR